MTFYEAYVISKDWTIHSTYGALLALSFLCFATGITGFTIDLVKDFRRK